MLQLKWKTDTLERQCVLLKMVHVMLLNADMAEIQNKSAEIITALNLSH